MDRNTTLRLTSLRPPSLGVPRPLEPIQFWNAADTLSLIGTAMQPGSQENLGERAPFCTVILAKPLLFRIAGSRAQDTAFRNALFATVLLLVVDEHRSHQSHKVAIRQALGNAWAATMPACSGRPRHSNCLEAPLSTDERRFQIP